MELLSPAGNLSSAYAAFKGGADAIYLGGKRFSARASANNFSDDEIKEIIFFAHSVNKKVYVTLNTLLFQDEFFEAVEFAKFLYSLNVDGVIIQDLGLAHYLHKTLPELPLNASTQLNCHNIKQAKALIKIGFKRIVLARETSLEFAKEVKNLGVEVEVFGHGALCVSYSGNCLLSSFIGNRSGNRGRCAQPCRMRYDLASNGEIVAKDQFLISTKDLSTIDNIEKLKEASIDSLKLEGRLKSEEYIYAVSKAYRDAIDKTSKVDIEEDKKNLTKIFSREFTKGYLFNESPLKLLNQASSSHQGEEIGEVVKAYKNRLAIKLNKSLHRLDGIRFDNKLQFGLTVENIFLNSNPVDEAFKGQTIELSGIENPHRFLNTKVLKTKDYSLTKQIGESIKDSIKVKISASFTAKLGQPVCLKINYLGKEISVLGNVPLEAKGDGTGEERILSQLQKSGPYPYLINRVNFDIEKCFIPISEINTLRNQAFENLKNSFCQEEEVISEPYFSSIKQKNLLFKELFIAENEEQIKDIRNDENCCFSFDSIEFKRENRISKAKEFVNRNEYVNFVIQKENKGLLFGSTYLNITNSYTLDCLYELGFDHVVLSSELNKDSAYSLVSDFKERHGFNPEVSIPVFGKLDMMIMRSCPIGTAFGSERLHCNICHQNKIELIDRIGEKYHIFGDQDCNVRMLNNRELCMFSEINAFILHSIKPAILFADESEVEIKNALSCLKEKRNIPSSTAGHFNERPL